MNFADVTLHYRAKRNMLEHQEREGKVKPAAGNYGEIAAVVLVYEGVWKRLKALARQPHHFAADIHCMNFAEDARKRARNSARAAPDLENPHGLGIAPLADIDHVVENVPRHGLLAGSVELIVGPGFLTSRNVILGVLARPRVPIVAHLIEKVRSGQ